MYLFPKLDPEIYPFGSYEQFVLDLLEEQKILVSHGTAFHWPTPDHFRFVILPSVNEIEEAVRRISSFLALYRKKAAAAAQTATAQLSLTAMAQAQSQAHAKVQAEAAATKRPA
jgi:alanine-synthesizing transaminase